MRDISAKITTLRTATASARLTLSPETVALVQAGHAPKGDPLPVARVAAVMAAKNTHQLIPYCHPLPVEAAEVDFRFTETAIDITVTVKAVHKTGVEMEALMAASIAALTLYDMLKPVDETMEIGPVKLLDKRGGKSDWLEPFAQPPRAAVLTLSDGVARGTRKDTAGALLVERLRQWGLEVVEHTVLPDDVETIAAKLIEYADREKLDLVMTTGGTGCGPRDVAPEATERVIERELPGIAEAARAYGQARMPRAMLSRARAGLRGRTLIVNLPGSRGGVAEGLDALLPHLFHAFRMVAGGGHDEPTVSE